MVGALSHVRKTINHQDHEISMYVNPKEHENTVFRDAVDCEIEDKPYKYGRYINEDF